MNIIIMWSELDDNKDVNTSAETVYCTYMYMKIL